MNLKTTKALGIAVPRSVVMRAAVRVRWARGAPGDGERARKLGKVLIAYRVDSERPHP
jgi:hypothetical protein